MNRPRTIEHLDYRPPGSYELDIEVMTLTELRRRAGDARLSRPERMGFYLLMGVTRGRCTHWLDFQPHECRAGTWLLLRPGQVKRYDMTRSWDAEMVVFRPDFLLPMATVRQGQWQDAMHSDVDLSVMPPVIQLAASEHRACLATVQQMARDAAAARRTLPMQDLLRHQLETVLLRMALALQRDEQAEQYSAPSLQRFKRFNRLLETRYAQWHRVSDYASHLGCSEKSLTRATLEVAGLQAKACISQRIVLEAQRLLAHTALPVATIAAQLGFDEATNFVKFFRRATQQVPTGFRQNYLRGAPFSAAENRTSS